MMLAVLARASLEGAIVAAPRVHISSEMATPLVVGVLRPRILLPGNGATSLSENEERMALCHELSHVKRADLWLGLVPAAAERSNPRCGRST